MTGFCHNLGKRTSHVGMYIMNMVPAKLLGASSFGIVRDKDTHFLMVSKKSKFYLYKVKKFSGLVLLITGILIVTGKLQTIGFYLIEFFPILQKLG
jgi:hypothetical protein